MYGMIKIGTSGFSFPDWVGPVYPEGIKKAEMLAYYERELGFGIVEINATYYSVPSPRTFESMLRKTTPGFEFSIKANKLMTHEIRDKATGGFLGNSEVFASFLRAIEPVVQAGRLTAVLAQFPYSFHAVKENYGYLKTFKERLGALPLVVEFRNSYWHNLKSLDFLRDNGIAYCVVDEPKLKGLMPYNPAFTVEPGYFRLHGRNLNWFNAPTTSERYDYLYTKEELRGFIPGIEEVAGRSVNTVVMLNNCHAGQAVRNAHDLIELLGPGG
jgi:uncharacterized protein YecE (DUF72 family)